MTARKRTPEKYNIKNSRWMLFALQVHEFFVASASQKRNDASRCADMATIIQNFAAVHPALCGTINHGSKERGNIRMMNRPFKPEFSLYRSAR